MTACDSKYSSDRSQITPASDKLEESDRTELIPHTSKLGVRSVFKPAGEMSAVYKGIGSADDRYRKELALAPTMPAFKDLSYTEAGSNVVRWGLRSSDL